MAQIWAAVRAGISRSRETGLFDLDGQPLVAAWLPTDVLPELPNHVSQSLFTPRQLRTIQLALPALTEALAGQTEALPLFIGVHEEHPGVAPNALSHQSWLPALAGCLPANAIDLAASQVIPAGRASGLVALEAALRYMASAPGRNVIVGAVDTFWDIPLLSQLLKEQRIRSEAVSDGFTPGEGAAFVVLTSRPAPPEFVSSTVLSVATTLDPGHRYGQAPVKGEGLATAIEMTRQMRLPSGPANLVFAGLNGEAFDAKQWGVARLRHGELFAPDPMFEHPADCFGDLGAALGAMLLVLADASLIQGHRESPALVWATSDWGACACAWLEQLP